MTAPHPNDYADGYNEGIAQMKVEIADILFAPQTDDPLDVLAEIADSCEVEGYDYFAGKGQWVAFPQDAD